MIQKNLVAFLGSLHKDTCLLKPPSSQMSNTNKLLAAKIVEFLKRNQSISVEAKDSLEVAIQCIKDSFELTQEHHDQCSFTLEAIFERELAQHSQADSSSSGGNPEEFKAQGNSFFAQRQYEQAVEMYSKAIALDAQNSIYYSNRAAAYLEMQLWEEAQKDCDSAIALSPDSPKAFSRKATALLAMEDREGALACYKEVLRIDPTHQIAKSKVEELSNVNSAENSSSAGGKSPLEALMQNPQLMAMASQMMANMGKGGAAGAGAKGGNPLAAAMNNPELMKMFQGFMGGGAGKK
jgi:small glutamine-rich tetratricopeptide repeat-containing protein alpha